MNRVVLFVPSGDIGSPTANHPGGIAAGSSLARSQGAFEMWRTAPINNKPTIIVTGGTCPYGIAAASLIQEWFETQATKVGQRQYLTLWTGLGAFQTWQDVTEFFRILSEQGLNQEDVQVFLFTDYLHARRFWKPLSTYKITASIKLVKAANRLLNPIQLLLEYVFYGLTFIDPKGGWIIPHHVAKKRAQPKKGF